MIKHLFERKYYFSLSMLIIKLYYSALQMLFLLISFQTEMGSKSGISAMLYLTQSY